MALGSEPSENELAEAIGQAAGKAFAALFAEHPGRFYYCSLITTGEALPPVVTAWSEEALEREARKNGLTGEARLDLKWSWGESPYLDYGATLFGEVRELFLRRPQMTPAMSAAEWEAEYGLRLRAMETAMARLDRKGVFGQGERRLGVVVNVEVMPPDHTNTSRALRLNPQAAISAWLEECAEPLPD